MTAQCVVEPKLVCPMHSEAKQTEMLVFGAEKGLLQELRKENGQLMLKRPELLDCFQAKVFIFIYLFLKIYLFIYLFIYFGCVGFSLLHAGFL